MPVVAANPGDATASVEAEDGAADATAIRTVREAPMALHNSRT